MRPFCFVLMPFGIKLDESRRLIDFDAIYTSIIAPAIEDAQMEAIRADKETSGGIIHKAMFERLMLCDFAVADLSTANANVFYELGVRHGIRPHSTVAIFGEGLRLPFDVSLLRCLPYRIDAAGRPETPDKDRKALAAKLEAARDPIPDSPLFQLVTDFKGPEVAHLKTDRFREVVAYSRTVKQALEEARRSGADAVAEVEKILNVRDAEPGILIDLLVSYRAVEAYEKMAELVPRLPQLVAETVLVQEQYGFALNRLGRWDEAEKVLKGVIGRHGASSETNGLLGRVYKDRWKSAATAGNDILAKGFLRKAIDTYLAGFEADWRDAYPGINAVSLMEEGEKVDPRQAELLPVVRYSVKRRMAAGTADYWDHATLLELAVLADDRSAAEDALASALAAVREPWEPKSTAGNLRVIREARERRGTGAAWIAELERGLLQ